MMYMYPFIHTKARRLTRRFLDGDTSLAEERWLEQYYAGSHVCPDLQAYRPMFAGLQAMHTDVGATSMYKASRTVRFRWAAAAAVVLCLLGGTGWKVYNQWQYRQLEMCYGGSFCIENGKRTDDLRKLRPHIKQTLAMASQLEGQVTQVMQIEEDLLNSVSDERQRQMLRQMLQ